MSSLADSNPNHPFFDQYQAWHEVYGCCWFQGSHEPLVSSNQSSMCQGILSSTLGMDLPVTTWILSDTASSRKARCLGISGLGLGSWI